MGYAKVWEGFRVDDDNLALASETVVDVRTFAAELAYPNANLGRLADDAGALSG